MLVLFASALATMVMHLYGLWREVVNRGRWWAAWSVYLAVVALFYGLVAWSYAGLLDGSRTPADHVASVRWLGPLLLLHPGLVRVAKIVQQDREIADLRERIDRDR